MVHKIFIKFDNIYIYNKDYIKFIISGTLDYIINLYIYFLILDFNS